MPSSDDQKKQKPTPESKKPPKLDKITNKEEFPKPPKLDVGNVKDKKKIQNQ